MGFCGKTGLQALPQSAYLTGSSVADERGLQFPDGFETHAAISSQYPLLLLKHDYYYLKYNLY